MWCLNCTFLLFTSYPMVEGRRQVGQPCPSFVIPHVHVRRRAGGRHHLADQVRSGARSLLVIAKLSSLKVSTLRRTSLPKLPFILFFLGKLDKRQLTISFLWENKISWILSGEVLQWYFYALANLLITSTIKRVEQGMVSSNVTSQVSTSR
jgi:hypothetical protein